MSDLAEKALSKAKMRLMLSGGRFLSSLALQLDHRIDNRLPTAGTNGKEVLYNEDFFMGLTEEERVALIAHEVWHVAFLHTVRRGERHPLIWNYAGDYVINAQLRDDNFKLPNPHLYEDRYRGLTTEQVYDMIMDEIDDDPEDMPNPDGFGSDIIDDDSEGDDKPTPEEQAQKELAVKEMLVKAATQAKIEDQAGSIPGEIARAIDDLINPKLNWKELLQRFVNSVAKEDYSWRRPNRRFFPQTYLPSAYSEQLGHIAVAIDTSGSVSPDMLKEMLSEIQGINDTFKPKRMTIMDCDYHIHNMYEVTEDLDILELEFGGFGGTSFFPVLDWARENQPDLLIYFTDLYAETITHENGYEFPCMWVCYSEHQPMPWGETVYYHLAHGSNHGY